MLFALFLSVSSVRPDRYTKCAQSNYCGRERNIEPQKWTIDPLSIKSEGNIFTSIINDGTFGTKLILNITFHAEQSLRIRVSPAEKENFNRFDTSLEPSIVSCEFSNQKRAFEITKSDNYCTIKAGKQNLILNYSPFTIKVNDETGEAVDVNFNDDAVFETNRDQVKYKNLFEDRFFNGQRDIFKNGPTSVAMSFRFHGRENRISGLPSHTIPLSIPDTTSFEPLRFFNTDINEFEVGNGMSMYGAVPFLFAHSLDRTVGFFWANPSETWIDVAHNSDRKSSVTRFISEGGYIDAYIFTGTVKGITDEYTQMTGRPMLNPRFALAYHQCRWGYMTQDDFVDVSKNLDAIGVPHDVMWLDLDHTDNRMYFTFHPSNFPTPKNMLADFARNKRYVVTLVDPHLRVDRSYNVYRTAEEKKFFMTDRFGDNYEAQCWPGRSSWPDYMNPETRKWWASLFSFDHYTDSAENLFIWNDMNEISVFDASDNTCPRDLIHYGDLEEREIHNIYGHMMVRATYDGLRQRTKEPMRPFILTRSFFAGSQKYGTVWSGDNTADWNHLKNSVQMVLSYGIAGIVYSGSDVGGFFNSPDDELLSRWFSVAAWSYSFFREHCHHLAARREINTINTPAAKELAKESVIERYMMLPYWYTLARESNETGLPIVRPMWYEFPEEEQLLDCDDQFMLGSSLLVVPFVEKGTKNRNFNLPKGKWYNFRTLQEHKGCVAKYNKGQTFVLQREGTIVPAKYRIRKSSELMFYDPYTLIVTADGNGCAEGRVYEDDGKSEQYKNENFVDRMIRLTKTGSSYKLTNELLHGKADNDFAKGYDVEIERIRIANIPKPSSIEGSDGAISFEYENGVLSIRKPNVLITESFEIIIKI